MITRLTRPFAAAAFAATLLLGLAGGTARAGHPPVTELLPKDTLLVFRVLDSADLVKRWNETGAGRMSSDEKVRPLIASLYGAVAKAFEVAEKELGTNLDSLLSIPQGEIAIGVFPHENRVAVVVMIDVGASQPTVEKLLARGETELTKNGYEKEVKKIGGQDVTTFSPASRRNQIGYILREGTLLITSEPTALEKVFTAWDAAGTKTKSDDTLTKNLKYAAIASKCSVGKNAAPQIMFYVDPLEFAKVASRGNPAANLVLAFLPGLGIDGLEAVGGSLTLATDDFDILVHSHLLLSNPRSGVLDLLALGEGDHSPEKWVPIEAASYSTFHWDVKKSFDGAATLYDSFRGEGSLAGEIKRRVDEPLGIDLMKEVMPLIDGRFSSANWMEPPARLNSQAAVFGLKLKDPAAAKAILEKLTTKYESNLEKKAYGGVDYFQAKLPEGRRPANPDNPPADPNAQPRPARARFLFQGEAPKPCFAIVGDYLLITDRPGMMEKAIVTTQSPDKSLSENLEYKVIVGRIRRQLDGRKPGLVQFNRPEEGMRNLYEMLGNEENRKRLEESGSDNAFLKNVAQALKDNPLPPFAVISQYLAPGGAVIINDDTGFHYIGFSLKRK